MLPGDIVKRKDAFDAFMTVESVSPLLSGGAVIRCVWFDKENKLRKLNFLENQLDIVPPESLKRGVPNK